MNEEENKDELQGGGNFNDVEFIDSNEDGEALPNKDVLKKIRQELKTCQKEKEEYLTGWQRAKADYINLQKEYENSHIKSSNIIKEKFLKNLLPALDSFDMAFGNKETWESVDKNWRMGIEYIYQQLMSALENEGIERIDKIDVIFDPVIHESIETILTDKENQDHKIEKIIQVGYKTGDRIIRPARVNVYEYKK